jgi:DNA-binding MarR family transcriptional regulator
VDDELTSSVSAVAFASRRLERALETMTLPQFRVLTLIANNPERASSLAERAAVTPPSLTGILDGLVSRGWVARSNVDGDRRGVTLTITPEGQAAFKAARAATEDALDDLLGDADAKTRAKVISGLTALHGVIRSRSAAKVTT